MSAVCVYLRALAIRIDLISLHFLRRDRPGIRPDTSCQLRAERVAEHLCAFVYPSAAVRRKSRPCRCRAQDVEVGHGLGVMLPGSLSRSLVRFWTSARTWSTDTVRFSSIPAFSSRTRLTRAHFPPLSLQQKARVKNVDSTPRRCFCTQFFR